MASLLTSISLFDQEYNRVRGSHDFGAKRQEQYEQTHQSLEEIKNITRQQINEWQRDRISAPRQERLEMNDEVLNRAEMFRTWLKIADWAVTILCFVAMAAAGIVLGGYLFYGGVFVMQAILASAFRQSVVFVLPMSIKIAAGVGIGSGIGALASLLGISILNRSETLREDRVLRDINFIEFIEEYVEKNGFFPTRMDLKDRRLHDIYVQWEKAVKRLDI